MFEKEAEEYADWFWGASPSERRVIKQAYQKGAEFGYSKAKEELEKENAELKEQVENRNCSNCRLSKAGCPNDGSCHNFGLWQPFINPELAKAKELIGELISSLSVVGECGEEECELINRAEQFIKE